MIKRIEIRARNRNWYDGIEILIRDKNNETNLVAQPITFEKKDPAVMCEPTLTIQRDEAQQLIDELWYCGLRPTAGKGSAGSLAATEKHLEDMGQYF